LSFIEKRQQKLSLRALQKAARSNPDIKIYDVEKMKQPPIYIMANKCNSTLYTDVTSHLVQGVYQHINALFKGFTSRYGCKTLVYYELFDDMENTIVRKKLLKAGSRKQKLKLIDSMNPYWEDLYESISSMYAWIATNL
jgi:predicted GIY-YIG superfamily endonuclease